MSARPGITLNARMDVSRQANIRSKLREPKRNAPGWSHSLHDLWHAYLSLERELQEMAEKQRRIRDVLRDGA